MSELRERYQPKFESNRDLNELIGFLKGKYRGDYKRMINDSSFKKLSPQDKEYVLDEMKAEGEFVETAMRWNDEVTVIVTLASLPYSFIEKMIYKYKLNLSNLTRNPSGFPEATITGTLRNLKLFYDGDYSHGIGRPFLNWLKDVKL